MVNFTKYGLTTVSENWYRTSLLDFSDQITSQNRKCIKLNVGNVVYCRKCEYGIECVSDAY